MPPVGGEESPARLRTNGRVTASKKITGPEGTHVITGPCMTQDALAAACTSPAW
uniref:Uncharacterized protein n=1 Tax=Nonomuraea gerenzanensis TaxID=93944 RepID=A0A1M4EDE0_9ACTN|nr:hypothetical protein BN4615_P6252 [Nonomuraea gerenzanensis]